jgi:Phage derived protein Gp49-like (DUF891)
LGTIELEPEVWDWLEQLPTDQFAKAAFYSDLLADEGPLLSEPYTRSWTASSASWGHLDRQAVRITYWIASGRRIVLLTVFIKTQMREDREIERARRALARCITEEHEMAEESEKRWASAAIGRHSVSGG